jgi:hypothetical protein
LENVQDGILSTISEDDLNAQRDMDKAQDWVQERAIKEDMSQLQGLDKREKTS